MKEKKYKKNLYSLIHLEIFFIFKFGLETLDSATPPA